MKKFFAIFAFLLMITGTSMADDFFNPPPLNPDLPPWMQDSAPAQPQGQNGQQPAQAQPQGQAGQQPAQQAAPEPAQPVPDFGSSDSGDDEEGSPFEMDGGGGGGGSGGDSGKQSFQILDHVDRTKKNDCLGWGTSFLGTRVFTSESLCHNELDQQLESARDKISNYADHTEKEVLRGVIKGKVTREKSRDFHLEFQSLKDGIALAGKTGCKCLE